MNKYLRKYTVRKTVLAVVLLSVIAATSAHTGNNHSEEQLEEPDHERSGDFDFVSGDYPVNTREIVLAEILVVALLLAFSVNHYRKKSSSDD